MYGPLILPLRSGTLSNGRIPQTLPVAHTRTSSVLFLRPARRNLLTLPSLQGSRRKIALGQLGHRR
jgi:hypothetical protein